MAAFIYHLAATMMALSRHDFLTLADFFELFLVVGQPGSGKTSTSWKMFLSACLNAGMGGLITTAKPGDVDKIRQISRACGRERSLVVISPTSGHRFNFLRYLMATSPDPSALLLNIVAFLSTIIDTMSGRISAAGGENVFFTKAVKEALLNTSMLLYAAYGNVTLYDLFAVLHSRPMSRQEARTQRWLLESFMAQTLERAAKAPLNQLPAMDYKVVDDYLTNTLANPDARTTGNIMATLSADLAPLLTGQLRELFNTGLNITPEHAIDGGAIIVLDFPVEVYGDVGKLVQTIFKFAFQKAVLRRHTTERSRPTFLLVDEASLFLSPYDAEWLGLARESRCATMFLTQNISSIYAKIGGSNPQYDANQLIGNFGTKIYHANGDYTTNEMASNAIGRDIQLRFSRNVGENIGTSYGVTDSMAFQKSSQPGSFGSHNQSSSTSKQFSVGHNLSDGYSEQIDFELQPGAFTKLRKGGKANKYLVDAIIHRVGTKFEHSGRNWMCVTYEPEELGEMRYFELFVWYLKWVTASPFLIFGNPFTWLLINVWDFYYLPNYFATLFIYSTIICGVLSLIGKGMKPKGDLRKYQLTKKQPKAKAPPTVALVAKRGGSAPSLGAMARQLPRELQTAMRGPVDRQPEAVLFEAKQKSSSKQEDAA